jgi:hypothetical protein
MATAEFEELKLSVVLVDDASSGLAALRTAMREFEGDSIRFIRNARTNAESYKQLGRETTEVVKGLRAAGTAFSRAAGVIGLAVGTYYKVVVTLSQFALEVEQVSNAARLAGVSYADLRNVAEQLARKGLSPESAGRVLGALNALGLQLQTWAGVREFENAILNSKIALDPKEQEAYIEAIKKARGFQERNAIVQNALRNIEKKGLEEGLKGYQIRINQKEFLIKNNLPEEMLLAGDLTATTQAQKDKWNKLEEISKLWTQVIHKIVQNVNTIIAIFNTDSMKEGSPFYLMLQGAVTVTGAIDKNLGDWLKSISEAAGWLAKTFGGSPEGKGSDKPAEGLGDFMLPPVEPMSGDDLPVKLEKLIKEFRAFHDNLRGGGVGVPSAPLEQHASLGSMATPGLQLPPAAQAGDIYTQEYGQWPGGGGKPYGSDSGPGRGPGAGGGALAQGFGGAGASSQIRPWRPGDPQYPGEPKYNGKPFPTLAPGATPLPPRPDYNPASKELKTVLGGNTYNPNDMTDVSEGRGVATVYSRASTGGARGGAWTDPGDPINSAALGHLPDRLQGISLSSPETLGQFFEVTDPNTGLTHVMQQTDLGPGIRTQKLVDISAQKAVQMGYNEQTFGAQQGKRLWDVRNAGFGSTYGPERATSQKGVEGSATQTLLSQGPHNLASGGDIDAGLANYFGIGAKSGMDIAGDRRVLDQGMGNEMGGKVDAGLKLTVESNAPRGYEITAQGTGAINSTEVNRTPPMEE